MGNVPFEWGPKEQATFDELKRLIASEEVTTQPHPKGKFHLEVNMLQEACYPNYKMTNGTLLHSFHAP